MRLSVDSFARNDWRLIYMATVEHEILGTGLWNYQMWTFVQPVRMSRDGRRERLDVYRRLVNANFNLNVTRASRVRDFEFLILDSRVVLAFRRSFRCSTSYSAGSSESRPRAGGWRR